MFGGEDIDYEYVSKDMDVTPKPPRRSLLFSTNSEQEEGYQPTVEDDEYDDDDPPSMTLKEILLTADTSHFDLLGMSLLFLAPEEVLLTERQRRMAMIWRMGSYPKMRPSCGNDFGILVSQLQWSDFLPIREVQTSYSG
jgi:hypothetical protein